MSEQLNSSSSRQVEKGIEKEDFKEKEAQNIAFEASQELQKEYPRMEISFDRSMVMGDIPMHLFSFKCSGIIPVDGISDEPKNTIAIQQLSKEELIREVKKTVDKYKKRNK